jgi:acyl-CoA thioesterase I
MALIHKDTSTMWHSPMCHVRSSRPGLLVRSVSSFVLLSCIVLLFASCGVPFQASSPASQTHNGSNGQIVYVALGASDTFGIGTDDPYHDNWANDLAGWLGTRYHLVNLGIPAITLHRALTAELPVALDAHPGLVTIWLAVNDIIAQVPVTSYKQDLNTMLTRLQVASPQARIAVANVPDLTLLPYFQNHPGVDMKQLSAQIQAYNAAIATVVGQHHAILVDLSQHAYDLQQHPEYVSQDGLHPTMAGYEQLALLFFQALQKTAN